MYMYICIHITGVNNWTKHIHISLLYLLKKAIVISNHLRRKPQVATSARSTSLQVGASSATGML